MLQEATIPITLDQGIDTKTDPKQVSAKFVRLENAVFTHPKRIEKRNGYTELSKAIAGGGSLVAPQMVSSLKNELVCADSGRLYGYSKSLAAWFDRGPYNSVEISTRSIDKSVQAKGFADAVTFGNFVAYAWDDKLSVYDSVTGAEVLSKFTTGGFKPRFVKFGGTTTALVYPVANAFYFRTLSVSGTNVVVGAQTLISTVSGNPTSFDVVPTSSGAVLAAISPNTQTMTIQTLNGSGAVVTTATLTETGMSGPVTIQFDQSTGKTWVYWANTMTVGSSTFQNVRYSIYSSTLTVLLAPSAIRDEVYRLSNIIVVPQSSTTQKVYFNDTTFDPATAGVVDQTREAVTTLTGLSGFPNYYLNGVAPYSKPFTLNGKTYAVFVYKGAYVASGTNPAPNQPSLSNQQPTYFLIEIATKTVVARFAAELALNQATLYGYYTPNLAISGQMALFACGIVIQSTIPTQAPINSNLVGVTAYQFDFNSSNAFTGAKAGALLCLGGGLIHAYDGQTCTEFGFHLYPEFIAVSGRPNGAGPSDHYGDIPPGTYNYIAVYQWIDANGDLHQSAMSNPVRFSVTATGGVLLTVTAPFLTQKKNVSVAIYRTKANGSIYYLVTDPIALLYPDSGQISVSFTDGYADGSLNGRPTLYTTGGVLENNTPQPSVALLSHNNRLVYLDSENRNTVYYTKSYTPGVGLSPSGNLLVQVDSKIGDLTALGEIDEKLIIFSQTSAAYMVGDGATDTGSGSTFSFPQRIACDSGCDSHRSIAVTPQGIMRKTMKGTYLMDRALVDHYIGAEAEAYNGQKITAAHVIADKSQVRFLTDSGLTLVYDYLMSQWSTFTNHTGLSADIVNGLYVYARSDGRIFEESPGSYLDGATPFSVVAQTGGLNLASIGGFQRVRRFVMTGDFVGASGHGVQVSAAYDYSGDYLTPVKYSFSGQPGVFQYRERLPIQKCASLSLLIEEVTTGATIEFVAFGGLAFEAGVKKGVNKLAPWDSVG